MKAYKVLVRDRHGFKSLVVSLRNGGVRYHEGKTTIPRNGYGPLCVYRTLREAKDIAWRGEAIFRCDIVRSFAPAIWDREFSFPLSELPPETILADAVTLLERVK